MRVPYSKSGVAAGLLWLNLAFLCGGCSAQATTAAPAPSTPAVHATGAATSSAAASPSQVAQADGKFSVVYDTPKKKKFKKIAKILKENGTYDELAERLNDTYILPNDVVIRFTELGEENAYWDPQTDEITVGYELIDTYSKIFDIDKKDPDAVAQEIVDAAYFSLFHEIGHALVALLEIPITGSEEDAVDEFATLALLKMDDDQSESALISGIEQFSFDAQEVQDISEMSFSDEHSFDKQRFYDVLSLVYGSDPERHKDLVSEDYLPEEMAETSEEEYAQKSATWDKLLRPHLRHPEPAE